MSEQKPVMSEAEMRAAYDDEPPFMDYSREDALLEAEEAEPPPQPFGVRLLSWVGRINLWFKRNEP